MINIAILGVCGKMGISMLSELFSENDFKISGGFDKINLGMDIGVLVGREITGIKVTDKYEDLKSCAPDVIIDFTGPEVVYTNICWAIKNSINIIVGATGLSKDEIEDIKIKTTVSSSKVFIVPNFSIGAVVMMKLSQITASFFENCEIIEKHHDNKKDAPSGTSIATAQAISQKKKFNEDRLKKNEIETLESSRGSFYEGIHIHSIRLPGLLAHQSVIFGSKGQTLTIKHDSMDRSSFYPGLAMAIRSINKLDNFTYGLESILKF